MAGTLTISGSQTLDPSAPSGRQLGPYTITLSATDQTSDVTLASGANTIPVPSTAVGVIIIPPAAGAEVLTLKGVTGDTGLVISSTAPTLLSFTSGSAPANIVVNSSAAVASPPLVAAFF